jgi:hypothetical protein
MSSKYISIASVPVERGSYSSSERYYAYNNVTMCSCRFQCKGNGIVNVPPLVPIKDSAGNDTAQYEFANTAQWTCILDNLNIYNAKVIAHIFTTEDDMKKLIDAKTYNEDAIYLTLEE